MQPTPINVISASVPINARTNVVDGNGELYVLRNQEDAIRANPTLALPLAFRANAGEDCIDVLLRNELTDNAQDPFNKVSAHIHFVQFDVQASDGVDTGYNFEQTVRPYRNAGEALAVGFGHFGGGGDEIFFTTLDDGRELVSHEPKLSNSQRFCKLRKRGARSRGGSRLQAGV